MDIVDSISRPPTKTLGPHRQVPKEDIFILAAKRKDLVSDGDNAGARRQEPYFAGEHYVVLNPQWSRKL